MVTARATCAALWKHQLKNINTGKVEHKKQGRGSGTRIHLEKNQKGYT